MLYIFFPLNICIYKSFNSIIEKQRDNNYDVFFPLGQVAVFIVSIGWMQACRTVDDTIYISIYFLHFP